MKAINVVMQLGTQSGPNKAVIPYRDISRWFDDYLVMQLGPLNGGYYTQQYSNDVCNVGYRENVVVISFILPMQQDNDILIGRIRDHYAEQFNQESVVTIITPCDVLL